MPETISKILDAYPVLGPVSVIALLGLFVFLGYVLLKAVNQGRAISIWKLEIGKKPEKETDIKKSTDIDEKEATVGKHKSANGKSSISIRKSEPILGDRLLRKLYKIQENIKTGVDIPYALLGSTYLDMIVSPISTKTLSPEEWTDLEPLQIRLGGSSMCVGRYLWSDYNQRSYMFTPISSQDDMFSSEFRRLLENEKNTWIIEDGLISSKADSAPLTILLRQLDRTFTTMFTHKGALASFSWDEVQPKIQKILSAGGVLYLSGFIKTNLSRNFIENLKVIHPNTLICIDHGRLNLRTDNPPTLRAIFEGFSQGLIDVYICSFKEILDFYHIISGHNNIYEPDQIRQAIESIAKSEVLPPVTIIRDTVGEKSVLAFSIVNRVVDAISAHSRKCLRNTPVAPLNAFNAAVLHHLIYDALDSVDGLRGHVIQCCQSALDACHLVRENDPSSIY